MKKIKKIIILFLFILFVSFSFAEVDVNPVYAPARFQPSNKFHAWCENQIDVVFHISDSEINWINAIVDYDSNNIEILSISSQNEEENNLSYTVESDKIKFSKLKSEEWLKQIVFSVKFKTNELIEHTNFVFETWSYILDSEWKMVDVRGEYEFQFMQVPECDPDIIAPSIELLFPSENSDFIALDSAFQFKITDQWKWINEDSIMLLIAWNNYSLSDFDFEWDDEILTLYPKFWLPINSWFLVEISVSDKQVYWGENTAIESYWFRTSDEVILIENLNPSDIRALLNGENCSSLDISKDLDVVSDSDTRESCDVLNKDVHYSVFAMIGWILFVCTILFVVFYKLMLLSDNSEK